MKRAYHQTPGASQRNAFCWRNGEPSIFATDPAFCRTSGASKAATKATVPDGGLHEPINAIRRGGISIPARDPIAAALTTKIMRAGI